MKKVLLSIGVIFLLGLVVALYLYNKPHRDIAGEKADFTFTAADLMKEFQRDRAMAESLYVDMVVEIDGQLSEQQEDALLLEPGLYCRLDSTETAPALESGEAIKLKARVIMFDTLMVELKLDHAVILAPK